MEHHKEKIDYLLSLVDIIKRKYIKVESEKYTVVDPVFHIRRNRVDAELLKSLIRLKKNGAFSDNEIINGLYNSLVNEQNSNGSFNEIQPYYESESALVTSFVGEALLMFSKDDVDNSLENAAEYVLSQEKDGYFVKSKQYTADHLNVNVSCGLFLIKYYDVFGSDRFYEAAKRSAMRVINQQWSSGAFPYTSDKGSYHRHLIIPCIHYQAVTLFYLIKINRILEDKKIEKSIRNGIKWMKYNQLKSGAWDWSNSAMLFSLYLSGSYAFALFCYHHYGEDDLAYTCLKKLKDNSRNLLDRYDSDNKKAIIFANIFPYESFKIATIGNYSIMTRVIIFLLAQYKMFSRLWFSEKYHDELFKMSSKLFNLGFSNGLSITNYPDMFMTSEVLEAVSSTIN